MLFYLISLFFFLRYLYFLGLLTETKPEYEKMLARLESTRTAEAGIQAEYIAAQELYALEAEREELKLKISNGEATHKEADRYIEISRIYHTLQNSPSTSRGEIESIVQTEITAIQRTVQHIYMGDHNDKRLYIDNSSYIHHEPPESEITNLVIASKRILSLLQEKKDLHESCLSTLELLSHLPISEEVLEKSLFRLQMSDMIIVGNHQDGTICYSINKSA